jgi:hypothetical protein
MSKKKTQEEAAYDFVASMVPRADASAVPPSFGPLWHGWALRAAYIAGYQQAANDDPYFKESMNEQAERSVG